ncbi:hypothetical protein J4D97_14010 [Hymenobacter defluvii]|uniref:Uncharacterized protein n=2 Tax=Hymenobacter defluvii TaxID=2054411 RepID=A0ABS3TGA2_9BACT|nr:hypothetical protein [Hymenobacter defluvii]
MLLCFRWLFLFFCFLNSYSYAQTYRFQGTMSQNVLNNYLDRAITMQGQSEIEGVNKLSEAERRRNIAMLHNVGAKFVSRIGGWWENAYDQAAHDALFAQVRWNVRRIQAHDQEVICQAAVFEYVSESVNNIAVPARVFRAFGLPVVRRNFRCQEMLYPAPAAQYRVYDGPMAESMRRFTPDVTTQEAQLWFYYMATRYLAAGCEAIHFGQVEVMNRRDVGNAQWWALLQKIRTYAATRNRGVVLCDGHVPSGGIYYEPQLVQTMPLAEWQSYRPTSDSTKQLVLDFHSIWVNYQEAPGCTPERQPITIQVDPNVGLHQRSLGGLSPLGWTSVRNPYLVELDNSGPSAEAAVGCNYDRNRDWFLWGWDEISWFAQQPPAYRDSVLVYSYYRIKQLDPSGHLAMPGMRGVEPGMGRPSYLYRCNTGLGNQQATIRSIWRGRYADSVLQLE